MARYAVSKPAAGGSQDARRTRRGFQGLQNQLNAAPQVHVVKNGKLPRSPKPNDFMIRKGADGISVGLFDDRGNVEETSLANVDNVVPPQSGSGAPTVDLFEDGQSGWYYDSAGSKYYWVVNYQGTLVTGPTISTLPGAITSTQHGNLTGGSLHAAATGTTAGFQSAAHFTLLNAATSAATASTLALRSGTGSCAFTTLTATSINASGSCTFGAVSTAGSVGATGNITTSGDFNCGGDLNIAGTRVVTQRQTGWVAPTGTASRATFDTATVTTSELAKRVFALLQDLGPTSGHGLINAP